GMWAFAVYDKENNSIFAARDRFGVKPFYYYGDKNFFSFCSEIPPLLDLLPHNPRPDNQSIFDFMVFNRTDQTENTFFKEVKKLPHGHKINISLNGAVITKWYDLKQRVKQAKGFESAEEFKNLLTSAITLRLRSDVPLGVCLSGGIDSSSIVSTMLLDPANKNINTFSAVYRKGQRGDETEFINEFSSTVKNMNFVTPTGDSLEQDLTEFLTAHAEPIPTTGAYAEYKVMQLAHEKVVVTLDGQGADEQLGGYHYFFGFYFKDLLKKGKIGTLSSEAASYLKTHKSLFGLKTFLYFMLPEKLRTSTRVGEKDYLNSNFIKQHQNTNAIAGNLYGAGSLKDSFLDHFEYKLEHLLKWEDRNSMHFSLESRVPFLDYRLVERSLATPSHWMIRNGMTKYILREAMKGILPEKIRLRKDKVGFGTPEDEWFRQNNWQKIVEDILKSDSFRSRKIIDPARALEKYRKHVNKEINISKEIWKWVHLELWFRQFIDRTGKASKKQVCTVGVWDETIPGIKFDEKGVSNYAVIFKNISKDYPRGKKGEETWKKYVSEIKKQGTNKEYDCVIGVSGGTDSSYMLHLAKAYGLKPLAVYLDNGWASEIAVNNIEKMTTALKVDLETYVIDYKEVVDVLRSYLQAGLPWADSPTDIAIKAILFKKAAKHNLKHILIGHDFKTEGFQPTEWTYSDAKQLKYLARKFSHRSLKSFPTLSFSKFIFLSYFKKIKLVKPFFYLDYNKGEAKKLLTEKYGWKDYGGHHYENVFTKFIITYWLHKKFGIDKRKITFSALILNNEMTREVALEQLSKNPYNDTELEKDIDYLCKKLNFSRKEFMTLLNAPCHSFMDYPSYYPTIIKFKKLAYPLVKYFLPSKPLFIYQSEERNPVN
ncbi:MAG: asnB2, partial [Bacteroidetes bacterium]|nr:asnB2 [Bacteroidota bacterium]